MERTEEGGASGTPGGFDVDVDVRTGGRRRRVRRVHEGGQRRRTGVLIGQCSRGDTSVRMLGKTGATPLGNHAILAVAKSHAKPAGPKTLIFVEAPFWIFSCASLQRLWREEKKIRAKIHVHELYVFSIGWYCVVRENSR